MLFREPAGVACRTVFGSLGAGACNCKRLLLVRDCFEWTTGRTRCHFQDLMHGLDCNAHAITRNELFPCGRAGRYSDRTSRRPRPLIVSVESSCLRRQIDIRWLVSRAIGCREVTRLLPPPLPTSRSARLWYNELWAERFSPFTHHMLKRWGA